MAGGRHRVQNAIVRANSASASTASGGGKWEAPCDSTKATCSPAATANSASVAGPSACSLVPARSTTRSGPATAAMPEPSASTLMRGIDAPYSKRSISRMRRRTRPPRPSTMRISDGATLPAARKSITATLPSAVSNRVSRISVPAL